MWYPLGRFWVEMFRPDAWRMGTLATAQWIAIGAFAVGFGRDHRESPAAGEG